MNDYQEEEFNSFDKKDENEEYDSETKVECDIFEDLGEMEEEIEPVQKQDKILNESVKDEIIKNLDGKEENELNENLQNSNFKKATRPNLCELILENLKKKYKSSEKSKSGTYNYSFAPVKANSEYNNYESNEESEGVIGNTIIERVSTNYDSNIERSLQSAAIFPSQEIKRVKYSKYKSSGNMKQNCLIMNFKDKDNEIYTSNTSNTSNNNLKEINNFIKSSSNERSSSSNNEEYNYNHNSNSNVNSLDKSNSSTVSTAKKVPILVNNLQTMYDINSERVRKRSEQMKKRKVQLEVENESSPDQLANLITNNYQMSNTNNLEQNKIKLSTHKKYKDDEEKTNQIIYEFENINSENELSDANLDLKNLNNDSANINNNTEKDDENENEAEIVVSDLDGDIEDSLPDTNNIISSSSKSFIPLQNHLRSKRAVSVDKATPSYLMALFQYEEGDSGSNSLNTSNNSGVVSQSDDHSPIHLPNKHNYMVDDIIEEETSENNTDSEIASRKVSSIFLNKTKRQSSDISNTNNYLSSPSRQMRLDKHPSSATSLNKMNYNIHSGHNSTGSIRIRNVSTNSNKMGVNKEKYHKNSKSEYISIRVDMNRILENIERKRHSQQEERLDKIKLRKSSLLNKFFKSNSQHNLPYTFPMSNGSNSTNSLNKSNNNNKKLSICTPSSSALDNVYKRLSPSSVSRAFYYDYEGEEKNESGRNQSKDDDNYINFNEHVEDDDEEDEGEVIQNKSIIEITDDEDNNLEDESKGNQEGHVENIIDNEMFYFNPSPFESRRNTAEKEKPKKSVFVSEDMTLSKNEKIHVVQDFVSKNLIGQFNHNKFHYDNNENLKKKNEFNHNQNKFESIEISPSKTYLIDTSNIADKTNLEVKKRNRYNSSPHEEYYSGNESEKNENEENIFNINKSVNLNNLTISENSPLKIKKDVNNSTSNIERSLIEKQNLIEANTKMDFINSKVINFEISSNTNFEILKLIKQIEKENENKNIHTSINKPIAIINDPRSRSRSRSDLNQHRSRSNSPSCNNSRSDKRHIYNNNYINNNINNISISIVNSDTKIIKGNLHRPKNNSIHSITNDIKIIYKRHFNSPSINYLKTPIGVEEKTRSNSVHKNLNKGVSKQNTSSIIITTPKKSKFVISKGDLKQFLTYSDSKKSEVNSSNFFNNLYHSTNPQNVSYYITGNSSLSNSINNTNTNMHNYNSDTFNIRVNSESSVNSLLNPQNLNNNKQIVLDAMKILKFQINSLDHQKFSLEKLNKSKAKLFCLLITSESKDKKNSIFEFRGLYEMNIEKNNLVKIYSVNYYPNTIELSDIKKFYHFDSELEVFNQINEVKRFTSDVHGFYMNYNYKKFYKG